MARPSMLSKITIFDANALRWENWLKKGLVEWRDIPERFISIIKHRMKEKPMEHMHDLNSLSVIDFEALLYELGFIELKILQLFYKLDGRSYLLHEVCSNLKNLNLSKTTIRRKLKFLNNKKLLYVIPNSNPIAIQPILEIKDNIKKLLVLSSARLGMELK